MEKTSIVYVSVYWLHFRPEATLTSIMRLILSEAHRELGVTKFWGAVARRLTAGQLARLVQTFTRGTRISA